MDWCRLMGNGRRPGVRSALEFNCHRNRWAFDFQNHFEVMT